MHRNSGRKVLCLVAPAEQHTIRSPVQCNGYLSLLVTALDLSAEEEGFPKEITDESVCR